MDTEVAELAQYLVQKLDQTTPHRRVLVGISGIPASGKSTLAHLLTDRINNILNDRPPYNTTRDSSAAQETNEVVDNVPPSVPPPQAIVIGLDGWHLTRAQLDVFPDPQAAHRRRGSHWTFDATGYVHFIHKLRSETASHTIISAPSFDHALKDPMPDAVSIHPHHRIVIIEGLYVFLSIEPWSEAGFLLDERWFIQVDPDEARKRLVGRHVVTGVANDVNEAEWRTDENDTPNGRFVIANMLEPTRVIISKDDPKFSEI